MRDIRNFVIIAHVDHGKSTLADRLLEITGTVEKRKMKEQYLDQLELERERGITIKMAPVRMRYTAGGKEYEMNLIDTPGHSDFSYEVSRALEAVEGAVLLVDITQGVQAQTIANFHSAQMAGLKILGAVNKVDLLTSREDPRLKEIITDIAALIGAPESEIHLISGKTGEGVEELLQAVVKDVPPPEMGREDLPVRALIFDSFYDDHKGVIASIRLFQGQISNTDEILLIATDTRSKIKEVGIFLPQLKAFARGEFLKAGETGYVATGIRDPEKIKIGDTLTVYHAHVGVDPAVLALPGFRIPKAVVFVSVYPDNPDDYEMLSRGFQKLRLNDSALSIEPDQNEVLGRGFKVGFLGRLHFEITAERLKREFSIPTVNTFPSVMYRAKVKGEWQTIVKPEDLPREAEEIWEPMADVSILVPHEYVGNVLPLQGQYRIHNMTTSTFQNRVQLRATMPLAELISDFDEQLKSMTSGFASFSYELADYKKADVVKVDILVAAEIVPGLSRFFPRETVTREARKMVERLKDLLPRQQFSQAIQASANGKILARETIPAMRKDVTGYLYGGDRTRKMKLWQKQKRGKKLLKERARVTIAPEIFKELLKK
ncbi:MAG: translation elongation factor 4 [Patescibacteria group bacterium]